MDREGEALLIRSCVHGAETGNKVLGEEAEEI